MHLKFLINKENLQIMFLFQTAQNFQTLNKDQVGVAMDSLPTGKSAVGLIGYLRHWACIYLKKKTDLKRFQ